MENMDLWKLLIQIIKIKKHEVTFHKVKGHADHPENIRCDALAKDCDCRLSQTNGLAGQ